MIAVNGCKALQIVTASIFAWAFLTVFLGYWNDTAIWPKSLPKISSKLASDKSFAHIQNETLGVIILHSASESLMLNLT